MTQIMQTIRIILTEQMQVNLEAIRSLVEIIILNMEMHYLSC